METMHPVEADNELPRSTRGATAVSWVIRLSLWVAFALLIYQVTTSWWVAAVPAIAVMTLVEFLMDRYLLGSAAEQSRSASYLEPENED